MVFGTPILPSQKGGDSEMLAMAQSWLAEGEKRSADA